jgi:hydroxyethylthiazole kinase
MLEITNHLVKKIKQEKPLILNLTNYVTMDFIANGLLSLGASPVMSSGRAEIEDLLQFTKALVINPGTLDDDFIQLCAHACATANKLNVPIILDPVGVGATLYRTNTSLRWLTEYQIAIVRGNASEVMALAGAAGLTKGVDSTMESTQAINSAANLAQNYGVTVAISGKTDFIVNKDQVTQFDHGSPLMPMVVGTGCLLSAVVGAFHAVEKDPFTAAAAAILFYSLCGEKAAENISGPGSFKTAFIDALHADAI